MVFTFHYHHRVLEERAMRAMVAGVELLDGQVVDSHQLYALVDQVLRAIGSQVRVVLDELLPREERGVASAKEDSLVILDVVFAQLRRADRANVVAEANQQCGPDQTIERDLVDWFA